MSREIYDFNFAKAARTWLLSRRGEFLESTQACREKNQNTKVVDMFDNFIISPVMKHCVGNK